MNRYYRHEKKYFLKVKSGRWLHYASKYGILTSCHYFLADYTVPTKWLVSTMTMFLLYYEALSYIEACLTNARCYTRENYGFVLFLYLGNFGIAESRVLGCLKAPYSF